MVKKLLALLMLFVVMFTLMSCSNLAGKTDNEGSSASDDANEKIDWTQGIAPAFDGKNDGSYKFDDKQIFNRSNKYIVTVASFRGCTQDDFNNYIGSLTAAGFTYDEENSIDYICAYKDSNDNIVTVGLDNTYLCITVGTTLGESEAVTE